jgi:hypothetical protein
VGWLGKQHFLITGREYLVRLALAKFLHWPRYQLSK